MKNEEDFQRGTRCPFSVFGIPYASRDVAILESNGDGFLDFAVAAAMNAPSPRVSGKDGDEAVRIVPGARPRLEIGLSLRIDGIP